MRVDSTTLRFQRKETVQDHWAKEKLALTGLKLETKASTRNRETKEVLETM
jgi:hypothetical protein